MRASFSTPRRPSTPCSLGASTAFRSRRPGSAGTPANRARRRQGPSSFGRGHARAHRRTGRVATGRTDRSHRRRAGAPPLRARANSRRANASGPLHSGEFCRGGGKAALVRASRGQGVLLARSHSASSHPGRRGRDTGSRGARRRPRGRSARGPHRRARIDRRDVRLHRDLGGLRVRRASARWGRGRPRRRRQDPSRRADAFRWVRGRGARRHGDARRCALASYARPWVPRWRPP